MTEAEPITDAEIDEMRGPTQIVKRPDLYGRFIARIDAERAAHATLKQRFDYECAAHRLAHQQWLAARDGRLAAEARVKVLEERLPGGAICMICKLLWTRRRSAQ